MEETNADQDELPAFSKGKKIGSKEDKQKWENGNKITKICMPSKEDKIKRKITDDRNYENDAFSIPSSEAQKIKKKKKEKNKT